MIKAHLKDEALLDDIQNVPKDRSRFHCWWLGQSGFLLQWQGEHLLFDPYLSDSLTEKYRSTDKPHVRMTERVIAPERLDFVRIVTSSHNHTDHFDPDTLRPLLAVNRDLELIVPEANREIAAARLEVDPSRLRGLDAGQSVRVADFEIAAVPAAHEFLDQDDAGRHPYLGYVVRFGNWTVYHSGDTIWYDGMEALLGAWSIDLAILPINGRGPERRVQGNLWGREAAMLAKDLGVGTVIPCHYEMFEFNTATTEVFVQKCEEYGQTYCCLRAGERWTSSTRPVSGGGE